MSVVELSDEENVAILAETFTDSLADLGDRTRQLAVLKRLYELLDSKTPQYFIYEIVTGCEELQVIRAGDDLRIFCRLVVGIPEGNKHYNVLFVFYTDPHRYDQGTLQRLDAAARERLETLGALNELDSVEQYLDEQNAFTAADIKQRIDRLQ